MENDLIVKDGTKIAIIGGGPAGTSFAIKLLKESQKKGIRPKVIIFEGKDFNIHYNQCVGVLSPPIEEIFINSLEMPFPTELVKREISGYIIHPSGGPSLKISRGLGTYATRRILFDRFMLKEAKNLGAEIINSRVTAVEFFNEKEVRIYSEGKFLRVDAVVGGFGLDEATASVFEKASSNTFKYNRPEKVLETIIIKIHVPKEIIEGNLKSMIHAFLLKNIKKIEFGAITPKGDHIIINIAGKNVSSSDMDLFLNQPETKEILGEIEFKELDYFKGIYPIKPAKGVVGNRFVAIGDATGWIRPYKGKGINVAIETGTKAAEVVLNYGFSKKALMKYLDYFKPLKKDYIYGKIFRTLVIFSLRTGFIKEILKISKEDEKINESIYMAVSGEGKYKEVLEKIFSFNSFFKISKGFLNFYLKKFNRNK